MQVASDLLGDTNMTRTSVLAVAALAALSSTFLVSTDASAFRAPAVHARAAAAPRMNAFRPATASAARSFAAPRSFATTRFSTPHAATSFRPAAGFNGNGNGNHNFGGVNGNGNGNHNVG